MTSDSSQQEMYESVMEEEDSMENRYLTFQVGQEHFGIEIVHVTEIAGIQNITQVPDMPDFVKGVINLRGQVIPVIDARRRFKLSEKEYDDRTCFIVLNIKNMQIGLVVDRVDEVLDIDPENIAEPPSVTKTNGSLFIKGLGKVDDEVKIILDGEKLIDGEPLDCEVLSTLNNN